jgi:hypothetical protein
MTPGAVVVVAGNARGEADAISFAKPRWLEVSSGAVVEVELEPPGAPPEPGTALPGQGAASLRDVIAAMPSGLAERAGGGPAAGARALLFMPGIAEPTAVGVADGAGRLTWGGLPFGGDGGARTLDHPTAVVWIPGATGAAFAEVIAGQPVRVTLPAPLHVAGRVTLGGGQFEGRNARVRVVASPQGREVFTEVLSVEASVEADGRFTL